MSTLSFNIIYQEKNEQISELKRMLKERGSMGKTYVGKSLSQGSRATATTSDPWATAWSHPAGGGGGGQQHKASYYHH